MQPLHLVGACLHDAAFEPQVLIGSAPADRDKRAGHPWGDGWPFSLHRLEDRC